MVTVQVSLDIELFESVDLNSEDGLEIAGCWVLALGRVYMFIVQVSFDIELFKVVESWKMY